VIDDVTGTNEAMTPKDPEPGVQHEAQVTIQEIVDQLAATHRGEDPEVTRAALEQAIADAGLPEQPEKFVRDTAAEVVAGRRLVIDRTRRDEDDPAR
jgi:predicted subunit of tRNA(5-methylaminomethyl-2-thiouridylate) methyltransferase